MTKKTDNKMKILFGVIGLVFLLLVMTGFENPFKPLSIAYENQCSLPSCPFGYTLQNRYCQGEICYGVCEKPVPAYCGSYGNWYLKEVRFTTFKNLYSRSDWRFLKDLATYVEYLCINAGGDKLIMDKPKELHYETPR